MIKLGISIDISRRQFVSGLAVTGAAAIVPSATLFAQAKPVVIDVHHHFWAPEYLKAQVAWEDEHHQFHFPGMMKWKPEVSLAEMDKAGVKTAMLSLASIWDNWFSLPAEEASRIAKSCCDYAAEMMRDHPGRFGLFAPLSMKNADLSLREIEYALDTIKADGIGLQTSYGDKYPGDPMFRPIFEELNRRKAVVFFHAPFPGCCSGLKYGVNASTAEVPFDTTRAIISLMKSGTFARNRNIKWIMPYGGGDIPFLASRITNFTAREKDLKEFAPLGVTGELKRLYYDTVNVVTQPAWGAMRNFLPASQMIYGTDYPYFDNNQMGELEKRHISAKDREAILSGNIKKLLPRLAKA